MTAVHAIAQVEESQLRPQPQPQPQPKLPATVNVASVLAKLEQSSSTLDLVGDGNISAVVQSAGKVLYEELVVDLGVGIGKFHKFKPAYCQVYKRPPTPCAPERRLLVVSPIPMVGRLAFGKYCDRNNFVSICRERSPPG